MAPVLSLIFLFAGMVSGMERESDANYWVANGQMAIERALIENMPNMGVAKNIILFIGDGMGVTTVTAARILKGQLQGRSGEGEDLSFDKMAHTGLVKTYCADFQTPDSASTATAILSGVKTNRGVLGLDGRVPRGNCSAQVSLNATVLSALHLSSKKGKSTGIVTNTRLTHATPAACYAHISERYWDDDIEAPPGCTDIALQLIEENPYIEEWGVEKTSRGVTSEFVENRQQLAAVDPSKTDYLLGIFSSNHLTYEVDKDPDSEEPSVSEMTEKAIEILQKNDKGFFLMVEGGMIDRAHHLGTAGRALHEVLEFDRAVETALRMTNQSDTLIIVTADHSHTMVFAGYQKRGNPILGFSDPAFLGSDGLPFTTLMYGTSYGYWDGFEDGHRKNLYEVDTAHKDYRQASVVPRRATHGGEDVAVYALGPMSHLLTGVHEQSYIAHVMMYASCVGLNMKHCTGNGQNIQHNEAVWNSTSTTQKPDIDKQNRGFDKVVKTEVPEQLVPIPNSASICLKFVYLPVVFAISLVFSFAM